MGLFGRKVGVVKDTAHAAMLNSFFPDIEAVAFDNQDALMKALKEKQVPAVFADALQLSFWMMSPAAAGCCRFLDGPFLSERHLGEGMTIMVGGQDAALMAALESALAALSKDGRWRRSISAISRPACSEAIHRTAELTESRQIRR